ncbi:MAG: sugar nucleotide-binding protein, partial [Planctomycetota bacterium]
MLGQVDRGRVLVTGAAGMLGSQLLLDAPEGFEAVGADRNPTPEGNPEIALVGHDLTDRAAVERLFADAGELVGVIHPAAYTAVDKAEEEPDLARAVNGAAAGLVAEQCAARGIPLVLVSTDFVFDGESERPYRETDEPSPRSVYGSTKLEGEQAAQAAHPAGTAIARTQWLYGPRGGHFPATMLRLASERDTLKVVHDQVGSPTSTLELSPALWDLLRCGAPEIYHAACAGRA